MRQSLLFGSLLSLISGSIVACTGAPDSPETSDLHALAPGAAGEEGNDGEAVIADAKSDAPGKGPGKPVSAAYPAPHPGIPQIPNHGGGVLTDPVIVSVTFPGDPLADRLKAFGEEVGSLRWWQAAVSPYGAPSGRSGGHVAIPEVPGSALSDTDVEAWLAQKLADGTLPAPTAQSLYMLYYPASTTVTLEGTAASCQTFLGYHSAITYKTGGRTMPVAYSVVNRCGDLDQVTETSSHEIAEAVSDPRPLTVSSLGYMLLVNNAWTFLGGENADMCAGVSGVREKGWALTRVLNNENAALGKQPCLPMEEGNVPYFNAGIVHDTMSAAPGTTLTTEVQCYSFGPLPAPMTLSVEVYGKSGLGFALDRKTCQNGDTRTLTITVPPNARRGADYNYSLLARLDESTAHIWRGMVHVK